MSRIVGYAAVPVDRASAAAAAVVEMPEVGGTDVGTPAGRRRAGRRAARSSRAATRVNAIERRPTDRPTDRVYAARATDASAPRPTDHGRADNYGDRWLQCRRRFTATRHTSTSSSSSSSFHAVSAARRQWHAHPDGGPRDRPFPRPVTIFTRSAADSGRHSADHSMKLCAQIDLLQHIRRTPLALYTEGARRIPSPANP